MLATFSLMDSVRLAVNPLTVLGECVQMEAFYCAVQAKVCKVCLDPEEVVKGCFLESGVLGQCVHGTQRLPVWNGYGDLEFIEV